MTTILVGLATATAFVDWVGVWCGQANIEQAAKPLVPVWLIAGIAVSGETGAAPVLVATALAFALGGDVALLPAVNRFVWGLGSFLIAHLLFIAAFLSMASEPSILGTVALAVALLVMGAVGHTIVTAVSRGPDGSARLGGAVTVYAVVLAAMMIAAVSTGNGLAVVGAAAFVVSDGVLGWNRFVVTRAHGRLTTHILYHTALVLLTAWVA
jgi:alkenylglycerophosphocholine/alkenylglycerophosphoethanolamine hydrolase